MKNNVRKTPLLGVFFLLVLCPAESSADPQITAIQGIPQGGNIITILGANMVNDDSSKWMNSPTGAGFEGAGDFIHGQENRDGWIQVDQDNCIRTEYVSDMKLMGGKSAYLYNSCYCPSTATSCGPNRILYYPMSSGDNLYVAGYVRYEGEWATGYLKMLVSSGPNQWYFQPEMDGSGEDPDHFLLKQSGWLNYIGLQSPLERRKWHHWEVRWRTGNPNIYQVWWNGEMIADENPSTGQTVEWLEWGIPNYAGSGAYIEVWFDRVAISSSRIYPASTIEVGNSETYGSGNEKWQEPVYLSDGEIQVRLDLTGMEPGPYYLWVTNNRQERSAAFLLGEGGGTLPPATVVMTTGGGGGGGGGCFISALSWK